MKNWSNFNAPRHRHRRNFFRAQNSEQLQAWYQEHLGIEPQADGTQIFFWRERENADALGSTVWAPFPADTTYFGESGQQYMFNYRVRDLDAMLEQLRAAGASVDDKIEVLEGIGRFGWATDPEGKSWRTMFA